MIVLRLLVVALLIAVAALGLAWLFTADRKYLRVLGRVLRFAVIFAFAAAVLLVLERLVLR